MNDIRGICEGCRNNAGKICLNIQPHMIMRLGKTRRDHMSGAWAQRLENRSKRADDGR